MLFTKKNNSDDIFSGIIHELQAGVKDANHPFHFMILATAGHDGPSLRYVVLREISGPDSLELFTYTDGRSAKVQEISENNSVSVLFWHPGKQVQIRVNGTAVIHQNDSISSGHRKHIGGDALKAYNQTMPPGQPINIPDEAHSWDPDLTDRNFTVLRIQPDYMDVLQLNGTEHLRAGITRTDAGWSGGWMAP